jgi:hypothetical protein
VELDQALTVGDATRITAGAHVGFYIQGRAIIGDERHMTEGDDGAPAARTRSSREKPEDGWPSRFRHRSDPVGNGLGALLTYFKGGSARGLAAAEWGC